MWQTVDGQTFKHLFSYIVLPETLDRFLWLDSQNDPINPYKLLVIPVLIWEVAT